METDAITQREIAYPINGQTWIIADTHFFHVNIGRYCDRPAGWQALIMQNWQRLIRSDEMVLHFGDLALAGKAVVTELMKQLLGQIFMLRGNHDRFSRTFYQSLGINLIPDPYEMQYPSGQKLIFSHRPILPLEPDVLNIHGHIHNNPAPELGPQHVNVSIEVREYRPWRLSEILERFLAE